MVNFGGKQKDDLRNFVSEGVSKSWTSIIRGSQNQVLGNQKIGHLFDLFERGCHKISRNRGVTKFCTRLIGGHKISQLKFVQFLRTPPAVISVMSQV